MHRMALQVIIISSFLALGMNLVRPRLIPACEGFHDRHVIGLDQQIYRLSCKIHNERIKAKVLVFDHLM